MHFRIHLAVTLPVIHNKLAACCRCFVIDDSGYVLLARSFLSASSGACASIVMQHITCVDAVVAHDMINNRLLISDTCVNYVNENILDFWKVSIHSSIYD
jgi:hypothetical protein